MGAAISTMPSDGTLSCLTFGSPDAPLIPQSSASTPPTIIPQMSSSPGTNTTTSADLRNAMFQNISTPADLKDLIHLIDKRLSIIEKVKYCVQLYINPLFCQDQKRLQEQLATEQETLFGSRPSPGRPLASKKTLGQRGNGNNVTGTPSNRRLSVTPVRQGVSASKDGKREHSKPLLPVNYVALSKDDSASQVSENDSTASSP